jgi:hypothetical protein
MSRESIELGNSFFDCILVLLQLLGKFRDETGERLRIVLFEDYLTQAA